MKRQNVNNKLVFSKTAVAELNVNQMQEVNGGTSTITIGTTGSIVTTLIRDKVELNVQN